MNAKPKLPKPTEPTPPVAARKHRYDSPKQEASAKKIIEKHAEVLARLAK